MHTVLTGAHSRVLALGLTIFATVVLTDDCADGRDGSSLLNGGETFAAQLSTKARKVALVDGDR
ncbi:MAG: hypothetical protein H6822_20510 [Planctomycetaceae bacterium]|nr:hypothetical protein [Planctomycetales bacterium]MCB9924573.1 hypothetical protein [Planctomycetaceae bacterium]